MTSCSDSDDSTSIYILVHPAVVENRHQQSRELITSHLLGQSGCRAAARKWFSCPASDSKEQDTFVCFLAEEDLGIFDLAKYSLYFPDSSFSQDTQAHCSTVLEPRNLNIAPIGFLTLGTATTY